MPRQTKEKLREEIDRVLTNPYVYGSRNEAGFSHDSHYDPQLPRYVKIGMLLGEVGGLAVSIVEVPVSAIKERDLISQYIEGARDGEGSTARHVALGGYWYTMDIIEKRLKKGAAGAGKFTNRFLT